MFQKYKTKLIMIARMQQINSKRHAKIETSRLSRFLALTEYLDKCFKNRSLSLKTFD